MRPRWRPGARRHVLEHGAHLAPARSGQHRHGGPLVYHNAVRFSCGDKYAAWHVRGAWHVGTRGRIASSLTLKVGLLSLFGEWNGCDLAFAQLCRFNLLLVNADPTEP